MEIRYLKNINKILILQLILCIIIMNLVESKIMKKKCISPQNLINTHKEMKKKLRIKNSQLLYIEKIHNTNITRILIDTRAKIIKARLFITVVSKIKNK